MIQNILIIFAAFFVSSVCGFISIPIILNFCKKNNLYDIPNKRKIHKNAIPRLGGICFSPSMVLAVIIAIFVINNSSTNAHIINLSLWSIFFFIGLLIIYVTGIVDDILGLGAKTKFTTQIIASTIMPASGLYINNLYGLFGIYSIPFWVGAPLTVVMLVVIINSINLIDGIDGLAGGLTLLALSGFLICFYREEMIAYCSLISGLMGVLVAYLYFNMWGKVDKNRKIFMGDSGSLTLGYILGFLLVKFTMHNPNIMAYHGDGFLISYTFLIVPCFDVVRVVLVRLFHHTHLFRADKNHIHHKLIRAGMSQHNALIMILSLAVFFIIVNELLYKHINITFIVLIDALIYIIFNYAVDIQICRKGTRIFSQKI